MVVLAGVDESENSGQVVRRALAEAQMRGEGMAVAHVFHPPVLPYIGVPIDLAGLAAAQRAAVWGRIEPLLRHSEVAVERVDLDGYPPDVLVGYAENIGASLLVIGSRGRGELAALLLGSTSHRAVHLAKCDVLVVKS
jgi:nucleotide-binding universal stress UspA family protein